MLQKYFFQSIPSQLLQSDLVSMYFSIELSKSFFVTQIF